MVSHQGSNHCCGHASVITNGKELLLPLCGAKAGQRRVNEQAVEVFDNAEVLEYDSAWIFGPPTGGMSRQLAGEQRPPFVSLKTKEAEDLVLRLHH